MHYDKQAKNRERLIQITSPFSYFFCVQPKASKVIFLRLSPSSSLSLISSFIFLYPIPYTGRPSYCRSTTHMCLCLCLCLCLSINSSNQSLGQKWMREKSGKVGRILLSSFSWPVSRVYEYIVQRMMERDAGRRNFSQKDFKAQSRLSLCVSLSLSLSLKSD